MILVFGSCGTRATVFVRCLLDFLESLGLHVFHRFYRWCFFFSRWDVRQVDVVPKAMYRICGSGEDGPIGRGADFQGNNTGLDPLSWLVEVGPIKTHHCIFGMKTS